MANYQDCRIRCSKETARQIIEYDRDLYDGYLNMNKALGVDENIYLSTGISFGEGCPISETEDGRIDIGFEIRWYPNLGYFYQLIEKYHDIEWWMMYEFETVFHYYYLDGEVIEDVHSLSQTEEVEMQELWDTDEIYPMLYTEKTEQSRFINFHIAPGSREEEEYGSLVNYMADEIARAFKKEKYDYNWTGMYRQFPTRSFASYYIRRFFDIDETRYKINILSRDVLDAIQDRIFPYDYNMYHAIFGLAIGDALGVPYEFEKRGTFECKGMIGYGSHDQPSGTWSDDTSMTLATLKSIKDNNGRIDVEDIRNNFLLWLNEGMFTANGAVFDVGHATLKALMSGIPQSGEYSNGNGSLMRILPLAFTDCSDEEIRAVSAITHSHQISQEACVIYVHVARRLLAGERISDIIPTLIYEKPFDRLSYIDKLEASEIKSSGYVVDTLEAALWAVSHREFAPDGGEYAIGYDGMVKRAVNLGEDTDTVAAVAGGLAGIIEGLGYDGHREWLDKLRNKKEILGCMPTKTFSKYAGFTGSIEEDIKKKEVSKDTEEDKTHTYVDVVYDEFEGVYSYAPGNLKIEEGDRVLVQRGRQYVVATVVNIENRSDEEANFPWNKLRPIIDVVNDETALPEGVSEKERPLFEQYGISPFDVLKYRTYNKDAILQSRKCGCYHCKTIFNASEIRNWLERDAGQTAICPYCKETFVLADESGLPVTDKNFIKLLNEYWFENKAEEKQEDNMRDYLYYDD
ncbi:MAG: ADP-ribosylglycohydrolase family protein [Erysipelotrichaceae bacterium]|nr:ADP-ribosylglycohydrolase family protein [Erysipelotrichaceae bacterium]